MGILITTKAVIGAPIGATIDVPKFGRLRSLTVRDRTRLSNRAVAIEEVQIADGFVPTFGEERLEFDVVNADYNRKYFESAFEHTVEVPDGYWVEKIEGKIPLELAGTYFRNGPGDFHFLNEPVAYAYDANGIIGSLAIKDGKAFFRSRFVKTKESLMEEKAGRRLFKGPFGTLPKNGLAPFRRFTNRNAASGKTFLANGRLYALYEGSPLVELDPFTLETLFPTLSKDPVSQTLDMALQVLPFARDFRLGQELDSYPYLNLRAVKGFGDNKYDGQRNVTICHSYKPSPKIGSRSSSTEIKFYEFGEDLKLKCRHQSHTLGGFSMQHSIGVTENYYIVNRFPMEVNVEKVLDPSMGMVNCIDWDQRGTREFHLVPRPAYHSENGVERKPLVFKMEATFMNHFVNAFEDGDKIVIDSFNYETYPLRPDTVNSDGKFYERRPAKELPSRFTRTICSLDGEVETHEMSTRVFELSNINPNYLGRRYQYVYLLAGLHPSMAITPQAITKVNLETGEMEVWTKGQHYYASEPMFVPRPESTEEDDGWVMAYCYNGKTNKTEFVILDAQDIKQGPIAILYLDHSIGHGFHGQWSDQFFRPWP